MPEGYIKARVHTSRAAIPLQNATVTVERQLEQGRELLSVQLTDRSGLTQPIAVPTPPLSDSQSPEQAKGWTDVIVTADIADYERVIVSDVQVFPGVTTAQDFDMVPLAELSDFWSQTEDFTVTPQAL